MQHGHQSSLWFGFGLRVGLRGGLRAVGLDFAKLRSPFVARIISFVRQLQQNIGVARLIKSAPTDEILAAQLGQVFRCWVAYAIPSFAFAASVPAFNNPFQRPTCSAGHRSPRDLWIWRSLNEPVRLIHLPTVVAETAALWHVSSAPWITGDGSAAEASPPSPRLALR